MKVEIYTTETCAYCKMAKEYFRENEVKYQEYDVATDAKKAEEMIKKSGQMGVPVIVVTADDETEEVIVGFDKTALSKALNLKE